MNSLIKCLYGIILFAGISGCATSSDYNQKISFNDALLIHNNNPKNAEYFEYVKVFIEAQNKYIQSEAAKCYGIGEGVVELILFFGEYNEISGIGMVVADKETLKAKCFVEVYNGRKFMPPPYKLFTIKMSMKDE